MQMIVFKEVRTALADRMKDKDAPYLAMLAGAITNELFGTQNNEEKFRLFREQNRALLEQELLSFKEDYPALLAPLTDALRVQTLCDSQEGDSSELVLGRANELGFLQAERDIPLPSSFMTMIRELGEQHNLIIPPAQINPDHDKIIH